MEKLTQTEERIMHILWHLEKGLVKDVIRELGPPVPKYTTVSSVIRILEEKGFVGHKAYGRTHEYYPLISKAAYKRFAFKEMLGKYFDGSYQEVVSFMVEEESLSEAEIREIQELIEKHSRHDR